MKSYDLFVIINLIEASCEFGSEILWRIEITIFREHSERFGKVNW